MIAQTELSFLDRLQSRRPLPVLIACGIAFFVISTPFLIDFVSPGLDLYLVLLALPFCLMVQQKQTYRLRYGWVSLMLLIAYYFLQIQTLFFLGVVAFICFFIEQVLGKLSRLVFIIGLLLSPVTHYAISVFSFPIRLKITAMAGGIMGLFWEKLSVAGNLITLDGRPYEVEPACLGLGMMTTGFILSISVLAYHEQQKKQGTKLFQFLAWSILIVLLIVLSNLFRIILLVLFDIPPSSGAHDLIGLFCLAFYVLVPSWFFSPVFVKGRAFHSIAATGVYRASWKGVFVTLPILAVAFVGGLRFQTNSSAIDLSTERLPDGLSGFKKEYPADDVVRFSSEQAVVYYKPCASFYQSTHTPTVCWKGSGLALKGESIKKINGHSVFIGKLEGKGQVLYTAWWYQSGEKKTVDQWKWRSDMLQSKHKYTLVNVASLSKGALEGLLSEHFLKS